MQSGARSTLLTHSTLAQLYRHANTARRPWPRTRQRVFRRFSHGVRKSSADTSGRPLQSYAEFIVSKKRILNVSPPDSYQHFIDLLNADDMHEIHQEVVTLFDSESGLRSSKQNPLLAHVIERAWNLIWNCTLDVRAPVGKAKKLDPRRAGDESQACCVGSEICAPNTCQCLDVPIAGPPPPTPPPVPKPPPPPRPAAAARTQQAGPVAAASAGAQEAEAAAADAPERKSHWWNFFG